MTESLPVAVKMRQLKLGVIINYIKLYLSAA
jgi:hypothetical protein